MKILPTLLLTAFTHVCLAQSTMVNKKPIDPVFPARKVIHVGLITTFTGTTPPPVLIGDATYGITEKFSMGLVAGTTGVQMLYGLKLNAVILDRGFFRTIFRLNAIYYPGRDGKFLFDRSVQQVMPWMFTLGIIDLEWNTPKGIRWSAGVGYLETHCIDGMMKVLHFSGEKDQKADLPLQFFNVVHGGVSIPLSRRFALRPEVVVVMKGLHLIEHGEYKVSPLNPYLNLVYKLGR